MKAIIEKMKSFHVADIGSLKWFNNQADIMTLHQTIVSEMQHGETSVTANMIHQEHKTEVILHELITLSMWKKQILTRIKTKDSLDQVFPIYSILFYESVCASVLLSLLYCNEGDIVNTFEEGVLCELIDHCVEHIIYLIGTSNKKEPLNLQQQQSSEDNLTNMERIKQFEKDLSYQVSNIMLSILRLIVDQIEELSIGTITRLVKHHDLPMLLVHLIENHAWTCQDVHGNNVKYNETWCKASSEEKFLLGKYEAQTWKMLLDLLMHPKSCELYEITMFRKNQLLKLEKHLHEIIIDQFPALNAFRQWFAQLNMTNGREVKSKPLILELDTTSIRDEFRNENWDHIAEAMLEMLNDVEFLKQIADKHQNVYEKFEKLYDKKISGTADACKSLHPCETCKSKAVFKCSRCRSVWYCNKSCQIKNWEVHRKYCSVQN